MSVSRRAVSVLNAMPPSVAAHFATDALPSRLLRPFVNRLVPAAPTTVVVRSGMNRGRSLLIHPLREKYYWSGVYEPAVQQALAAVLGDGMSFWDVGAHIGFFALIGSTRVGPTGQVCCFEPQAENRMRLKRNIALNGLTNVTVYKEALDEQSGVGQLYRHPASSMWSLEEPSHKMGGQTILRRTLDEVADEIGPPDVVKIDAECSELRVLRGGKTLLSEHRPALLVEFSAQSFVAEARDFLAWYQFEHLGGPHWLLT